MEDDLAAENQGGAAEKWLTAEEVAGRLNIKRETVYAYVSRGRLASRRSDDGRGSVFDPLDVERLAARVRRSGKPGPGTPESAITLIQDGRLSYRGIDARRLAAERSFEDTAELLWGADRNRGHDWEAGPDADLVRESVGGLLPLAPLPIDQLRIIASLIGAIEPPGAEGSADVVAASARRMLMTMIAALPQHSKPVAWTDDAGAGKLVPFLWSRLCARAPSVSELRALSTAMVVGADHDLASATMVVRTAARAGVDPGGIIRLGLDVGSGPVKGAAGFAIETFLRDVAKPSNVESALVRRLRQGEPVPGFGHVMYPDGDPRAAELLDRLREADVDPERLATVEEVIARQMRRGLPPPNAGFSLSALSYATDMIPGAGEVIFVLSRTAGWIAHAIEEYGSDPLPRLNSVYVGQRPAA
ncbi:MAG TPA: citrate synthase [Baekduia sp.]|jgi:citrate synthase